MRRERTLCEGIGQDFAVTATLHFFDREVLSIADTRDSGLHAHRAAQLMLGLDGGFDLVDADGHAQSLAWAVLPPGEEHRIRGTGGRIAYLFVDPGLRTWNAWRAAGGVPAEPAAALVEGLRDLSKGRRDVEQARRLAGDWRAASLPGLFDAAAQDARIARALAAVDADPVAEHDHRRLAALAHLSPSRFAERFRVETGMPVRNYLLWRRLLTAVAALEHGDSVTEAAHRCGFADAAHLSRSFRRVLGAAPSELRW